MRQEEKRQAKKDEETKGYHDYNWEELYKSGNLKKVKFPELNKYVFHHNMSRRKMSKSEKLNLLSAHIRKGLDERILTLSIAETAADWEPRIFSHQMMSVSARAQKVKMNYYWDLVKWKMLAVRNRVNCYGRRVGNWRLRLSS